MKHAQISTYLTRDWKGISKTQDTKRAPLDRIQVTDRSYKHIPLKQKTSCLANKNKQKSCYDYLN